MVKFLFFLHSEIAIRHKLIEDLVGLELTEQKANGLGL